MKLTREADKTLSAVIAMKKACAKLCDDMQLHDVADMLANLDHVAVISAKPDSVHLAVISADPETRLMGERRVHAENYHADTINDLEMALDSARRGYWKQCAVRAATASKSAAKWNHAADIWLEWKAKPSAQQEGKQ